MAINYRERPSASSDVVSVNWSHRDHSHPEGIPMRKADWNTCWHSMKPLDATDEIMAQYDCCGKKHGKSPCGNRVNQTSHQFYCQVHGVNENVCPHKSMYRCSQNCHLQTPHGENYHTVHWLMKRYVYMYVLCCINIIIHDELSFGLKKE